MKIYVFGNEDVITDSYAINLAKKFNVNGIEFEFVKPNADLPFDGGQDVIIMDQVIGLNEPKYFELTNENAVMLNPRTSTHEFNLGFQLRYLKKLGRLGKVMILGLPITDGQDLSKIESILKDMSSQSSEN